MAIAVLFGYTPAMAHEPLPLTRDERRELARGPPLLVLLRPARERVGRLL
jgi:hypothetical protein